MPKVGFGWIGLIILLVIIALIIAGGYILYPNILSYFRDNQRGAELRSIARIIEVNRNPAEGYLPVRLSQFPNSILPGAKIDGNVALDPLGYAYCMSTEAGIEAPEDYEGWDLLYGGSSDCPKYFEPIENNSPRFPYPSFIICARLENSPTPYCIRNKQ